jgi:uncharacterized membrane protein HdeD (DUF308 family)
MTTETLSDDINKRSAWSIFMGFVTAALGVFMIIYPLITAEITTVLLGWALIFVGVAQLVFALNSQTVGNFFLKVLLAVLYGLCGIGLAFFPVGLPALTATVGTLLLLQGVLEAVAAFQLRPLPGWGWFLFDALASLLLGILILAEWPSSSVWAIGTLVGVAVLMNGISRIVIGTTIRSGVGEVKRMTREAA